MLDHANRLRLSVALIMLAACAPPDSMSTSTATVTSGLEQSASSTGVFPADTSAPASSTAGATSAMDTDSSEGSTVATSAMDADSSGATSDGSEGSTTTGPSCGNDMIEGPEPCDGVALGGEDCISQGFAGGVLACALDCSGLDTTGCTVFGCMEQDIGNAVGTPVAQGNTDFGDADFDACGGIGIKDQVITWTVPMAGDYTIDTQYSNSLTHLGIYETCAIASMLECNANAFVGPLWSRVDLYNLVAGQTLIIVVKAHPYFKLGNTGDWDLNITYGICPGLTC